MKSRAGSAWRPARSPWYLTRTRAPRKPGKAATPATRLLIFPPSRANDARAPCSRLVFPRFRSSSSRTAARRRRCARGPHCRLAQQQPDDPPSAWKWCACRSCSTAAYFRPGKIDGLGGEFTQKAADRYYTVHGIEPGTRLDTSSIPEPNRSYTVTEQDVAWTGPVAAKPQSRKKLKRLPYADTWEELAEKFHTDLDFIQELNPSLKEPPKAGDVRARCPTWSPSTCRLSSISEAAPRKERAQRRLPRHRPLPRRRFSPTPTPAPEPKRRLVLLREPRLIELYEDDKLAGCFPCTPGSQEFPVPPGNYKITVTRSCPTSLDKSVLETGKR